jgi:hypothetical protein
VSTQLQPPTQKVLGLSAQLEDELLQLRQRRPVLTGEIAAAHTAMQHDNAALATSGGQQRLDAASASTARVAALKKAAELLDEQIARKEQEVVAAKATERWEAAVAALVPVVDSAAEAVRIYESYAEMVNKFLIEHIPEMAASYRQWEQARKEFVDAVRSLIPGVTPSATGGSLYGRLVTPPEAEVAAQRLLEELEARCADVRPVLAPVAGADLCIDLKTFQLALPQPYSDTPHMLAQNLVAEQKKAEKHN